MKIEPIGEAGDHRTGTITGLDKSQIVAMLGFQPNVKDDPSKVKYSWGFVADNQRCGIWDYYFSYKSKSWSTFGPHEIFEHLFGSNYKRG